jgi:hypothetical protein
VRPRTDQQLGRLGPVRAMNQAHGRRRELHAQILGEFQDLGEEATLFEIAPEQTGVEDESVNLVRLLGVELGIDERAQPRVVLHPRVRARA